ncbi:MAG: ATP-binding protein [Solirubrobacteraceae bacterium]
MSRTSTGSWAGLSRLPTRVRLTLVFAITMGVVLALTGLFVYLRFRAELDRTIDLNLRTQTAAVVPLIGGSEAGLASAVNSPLFKGHESFVQVLDMHGRIVAATRPLRGVPLLTARQVSVALRRTQILTRGPTAPLAEGSRLLTTPVATRTHGPAVLVVGTTLDERATALSSLTVLLALVGPLALIVACGAGYGLASATLRPVELMRRRAAAVSASEPGRRLPLPAANDEIRRLGITLNEMLERLEESFAREQTFVANASHELRTPLTTLKAELELALRRERSAGEMRDALVSVNDEVDQLLVLAEELLVLARSGETGLPIQRVEIDAIGLLNRVRDRFDPQRTTIAVSGSNRVTLVGDPHRLEEALGNLVDNALRYGGSPVTMRAAANEGAVELHVEDTGAGFPPGFEDQAFERFTRASPGRAGRGAGLGLSIVRAIAQAHGGDAHAANLPAGGADVWIVIPDRILRDR